MSLPPPKPPPTHTPSPHQAGPHAPRPPALRPSPRYYLSGNDAYRLKLQLPLTQRYHERLARERDAIYGVPEDMGGAAGGVGGGGGAYEGEVA